MTRKKIKDYGSRWRDQNLRALLLLLVFVTYVPAQLWLGPLISRLVATADGGLVVFVVWGVGLVASGVYLLVWRCPRCRKYYGAKGRWMYCNPFALRCVNCKLPRWSRADGSSPRT
jgi:hypothetical protein